MRIVFTVLYFLVTTSAFAQNFFSANVGVNLSSVSSVNSTNPDAIIGLSAGFAYKIYMNDLGWFLKPGAGYSQEGYQYQRLNYINIPLVVGFDFTDDFNLNAGFQYGILVGGLNDPSNNFFRSNMSFLIGFEFYPTERFEVGLRFSNGIKNLVKEPDAVLIDDARTYSIQLYFTYNFIKPTKK